MAMASPSAADVAHCARKAVAGSSPAAGNTAVETLPTSMQNRRRRMDFLLSQ
jgi:hypothetical protein